MSKIENILEVSKRMVSINFTYIEALQIMKDEKATEYINKLSECYEKNSNDDNQFLVCTIKSLCPEETEIFASCQKENKNDLMICAPIIFKLEDCMRSYSDRTLEIFKKAKIY
jgi:hypothetical protein